VAKRRKCERSSADQLEGFFDFREPITCSKEGVVKGGLDTQLRHLVQAGADLGRGKPINPPILERLLFSSISRLFFALTGLITDSGADLSKNVLRVSLRNKSSSLHHLTNQQAFTETPLALREQLIAAPPPSRRSRWSPGVLARAYLLHKHTRETSNEDHCLIF